MHFDGKNSDYNARLFHSYLSSKNQIEMGRNIKKFIDVISRDAISNILFLRVIRYTTFSLTSSKSYYCNFPFATYVKSTVATRNTQNHQNTTKICFYISTSLRYTKLFFFLRALPTLSSLIAFDLSLFWSFFRLKYT